MIKVNGKEYSEDTLQKALEAYVKPDDTIYVPEGIEFEGVSSSREGLGLVFGNKQVLFWGYSVGTWKVYYSDLITKVKYKLIPCKREDLRRGDWGYAIDWEDPYESISSKDSYKLILNDKEHLFVSIEGKNIICSAYIYDFWYKVVPVE